MTSTYLVRINDVTEHRFQILNPQATIKDLIEEVNKKYKFPKNTLHKIVADDKEFSKTDMIFNYSKAKFRLQCNCEESVQLFHPYLDKITIKADVCKTIIELEKQIAQIIQPNEYGILINDPFLDKNQFLSQVNRQQLKLQFRVTFYVNFENQQKNFEIEAFEKCSQIKSKIFDSFNIKDRACIQYKDQILEDEEIFASYMIPNLSELKIQMKTNVILTIKHNETLHKFQAKTNQKIEAIIQSLRKYFQIHEDQQVVLRCRGSNLNPQKNLQDSGITEDATVEMKIEPSIKKIKVRIHQKDTKMYYIQFLYNNQKLSDLDKLFQLQNRTCTYYLNSKQLNKHISFMENGIGDAQLLDITVEIINQQQIKVKFESQKKSETSFVGINDSISQAISQFSKENQTILAFYKNEPLDIFQSYQAAGVKDGDTITYQIKNQEQEFLITINGNIEKMSLYPKITGTDLIKIIQKNFKVSAQCKLKYGGVDSPLDRPINEFYDESQVFDLVQKIPLTFYVNKFLQTYEDFFYEDETFLDISQSINQKFDFPPNITLVLTIDDQIIKQDSEVKEYKGRQIDVKVETLAHIKFVDDTGKVIKEVDAEKTSQISDFFDTIYNQRFVYNGQVLDIDQTLDELGIDSATIIIETSQTFNLINRQNTQETYSVSFFPDQTLTYVVSEYVSKKFDLYYENQLINADLTFQQLGIQNNEQLYYDLVIEVKVKNKNNISQTQKCKLNDSVQSLLQNFTKYLPQVFYQGNQINDLSKTLNQIIQDQELEVIEFTIVEQLIIIIQDGSQFNQYSFDGTKTLADFRKDPIFQSKNKNNKCFYFENRQLAENQNLFDLFDKKPRITLIYQEQKSSTEFIHEPSGFVSQMNQKQLEKKQTKSDQKVQAQPQKPQVSTNQNNQTQKLSNQQQQQQQSSRTKVQELKPQQPAKQQSASVNGTQKIKIRLTLDNEEFWELVDQNQTVGDFLQYFESKNEFSSITLFYEGEEVNYTKKQKTFQALGVINGSEFEIY